MRLLVPLILGLLFAGCQPGVEPMPEPEPVPEAERDSVIALLERSGTDALERAFDLLAERPHTLRERLHQLDESGRITAYRRRTVAVEPPGAETVFAESEGTFDFGAFGRFVSLDDLDDLPQNPVPFLLADDPPYLTPQGRSAYHFAFGRDTTLAGARVRVAEVTALPGEGDDQPVRWVRLYIDSASEQVIGLRLRRHTNNLLFGESSLFELDLSPHPAGAWLPARSNYRVGLRAALTATRHFQLTRLYEVPREGFAGASGAAGHSRNPAREVS